jgi:hypothetical protein
MENVYQNMKISEPRIVDGIAYYQHKKLYKRPWDGRICMYVDHGDGSGYLEERVEWWGQVTDELMMERPEMRALMGWK